MHLLLESDWSIVLIMTGAVKQIVEEGRILVTVHHIFSTNNGMQNLISALKTSQPNGFTVNEGLRKKELNFILDVYQYCIIIFFQFIMMLLKVE